MSSLEIAELTGKRHDNVIADIQRILDEAEVGALKFKGTYTDDCNREKPCYHLPRLECDLVVSGYSVPYRLAIIRRCHELEAKEAGTYIPPTRSEALRLAADLADQNAAQARQLEIQTQDIAAKDAQLEEKQPAVEFYEKFADRHGRIGIRETAKALGPRQSFPEVTRVALCCSSIPRREIVPHRHKPPPLTGDGRPCFRLDPSSLRDRRTAPESSERRLPGCWRRKG
jgi:Rha family phage regulatory protein